MGGLRDRGRTRPIGRHAVGRRFLLPIAVVFSGLVVTAPAPAVPATGVEGGAAAVWDVDQSDLPRVDGSSFVALVSRLGCNNGETGVVFAPTISEETDRIVVTFTVEPLPPGAYTCPGNRPAAYTVELDQPIGERPILDGACLAGEAATTSFCADGAVRWSANTLPTTTTSMPATSIPATPPPPCPVDGSTVPGAAFCVVEPTPTDGPPIDRPPSADPARPVAASPSFTG